MRIAARFSCKSLFAFCEMRPIACQNPRFFSEGFSAATCLRCQVKVFLNKVLSRKGSLGYEVVTTISIAHRERGSDALAMELAKCLCVFSRIHPWISSRLSHGYRYPDHMSRNLNQKSAKSAGSVGWRSGELEDSSSVAPRLGRQGGSAGLHDAREGSATATDLRRLGDHFVGSV